MAETKADSIAKAVEVAYVDAYNKADTAALAAMRPTKQRY